MIAISFTAIALILQLVIVVVVVRKYVRTRDIGFIWLGVAAVIWPALNLLLNRGEHILVDRLAKHQPIGFYPFSLVERGNITIGELIETLLSAQRLVGVILLLVAVAFLYRDKDKHRVTVY
jgi:hypothetical protein